MKRHIIRHLTMFIFVVLLAAVTTGCKKEKEIANNPLVKITDAVKATDTPTPGPSATPTPIIDMPSARYDAEKEPRSTEDEEPEIIEFEDEVLTLNPFYADTELAQEIVEKTQAPLFYIDESGKALAGIEYPCIAYEYEFIDDTSMFGSTAHDAGDDYRVLRVVLKEGISFCDGEAVTISDVVYSAHVLGNPNYGGPLTYYENDIYGMKEYRTQVSEERRKKAEQIKAAGIKKDGSLPAPNGFGLAEQKEFWSYWDEAGLLFAEDIIDYVNTHYGDNAYVQAFLSNQLTYAKVRDDESLRTAYAFAIWGYMKDYNSKTRVMTDTFGNVYKFDEAPLTAQDLYNVIFEYYGYDLDDKTGINYECPKTEKHFEDYITELYLADGPKIEQISGISTGAYRYEDQAMRGCVYFLVGKDTDPAQLNLYVVPKHIYLGNERLGDLKGAGEYYLEGFSETDNTITLVANDSYMLGSPRKKYIKYVWKE